MNKEHLLVFILTFLGYAGLHSLRQGWAYSKTQIKKQFDTDKVYFGLVDTFYLVSYSVGMVTIGNLSNKIKLTYFVSFGMIASSIFYMAVAISYFTSKQFIHVTTIIFMCLNGFFQCTGWPGLMGIMGNWFEKGKTGIILGIWAINANIGNIIAELVCNLLEVNLKVSWGYNFLVTGIFNILIALLILLFLKQKPHKQQQTTKNQLQDPLSAKKTVSNQSGINTQEQVQNSLITNEDILKQRPNEEQQLLPPQRMNVFRAFCFPRVPFYVIGYAMLKGCIYGLLFWLPTYLSDKNLSEQKGYISSMVDTGSFIGGLIIGHLGDKYKYRALFLSPLLFCSSVVMFMSAYFLSQIAWQYYLAMFMVGITIGGPYNIIGTVITIDLGRQTKQKGGSTATISALVEGSAAIFAAGSQTLISALEQSEIFYVFFGECIIAAIVLFPLFRSDWKQFNRERSKPQMQSTLNST